MKPSRVLLFIVCVMSLLGVLCVVLPGRLSWGEQELRWPSLAEVFGLSEEPVLVEEEVVDGDSIDLPEFTVFTDTLPDDSLAEPVREPIILPYVQVDSTTDSRLFLRRFYASLHEASTRKVRVIHYGDSQIEEDRITMQIREQLQAAYGGRGVGLMPLAQTIPTISIKQQLHMNGRLISPMQGPRRYLVYGFKRDQRKDGLYGVMGQMAEMNDSLVHGSESLMAVCTPQEPKWLYDEMRVIADNSIHYTRQGDTLRLSGRGKVYGISQESSTGVIVDNIPMRGCLGLVFTKIDSTQLTRFYAQENVRLIILQFGGNAIPFNEKPTTIQSIVRGLREQVRYLQHCAPEADILFIGPSDMMRQVDGQWETFPMVPYLDKLLKKMAQEEHIAYFSLYRWMGGAGSMKNWQEIGLAGSDGIHFYRSGARKAGNAIGNWLLEPMDSDE